MPVVMTTFSLYVPTATLTVSPEDAALMPPWTVLKIAGTLMAAPVTTVTARSNVLSARMPAVKPSVFVSPSNCLTLLFEKALSWTSADCAGSDDPQSGFSGQRRLLSATSATTLSLPVCARSIPTAKPMTVLPVIVA